MAVWRIFPARALPSMATETPAGFLQRGFVYLPLAAPYFAQQLRWIAQHAPPLQQSAKEVADAVPTNATAARIISRYFICILC